MRNRNTEWSEEAQAAHEVDHALALYVHIAEKNAFARIEARLEEIAYALEDIQETIQIWRDEKPHNDPYMVKLHAEFDALIEEKQRILEGK